MSSAPTSSGILRVPASWCSQVELPFIRQQPAIFCGGVLKMIYICPVCGYPMSDPPRDYNICPSCGTEFGYEDSARSYESLRNAWFRSGAAWWSPVDPIPHGWNPLTQLENLDVADKAAISIRNSSPVIFVGRREQSGFNASVFRLVEGLAALL
jgi:hypothetical protein